MSELHLALFESPTAGRVLADLSHRVTGLSFRTNRHGFADLECFAPMRPEDAFRLYDGPKPMHCLLSRRGLTVWEGRVEDVAITGDGVRLTALGYWRAYFDVPHTELWSTTSYREWEHATLTDRGDAYNQLFEVDFNNRIYIAPRSGETFGVTGANKACAVGYFIPSASTRQMVRATFDYSWTGIDTNWVAELYRVDSAWGSGVALWTLTSTAATQSGSQAINYSANPMDGLMFIVYRNAGDAVLGGNTGDVQLRITNFRAQTTISPAIVYANEIIQGMLNIVQPINPTQIQNVTALIESPAIDLRDEVYLDEWPADILDRLAALGDDQTPPRIWEVGVWENRILHFRPRGSQARAWYVDISEMELERTIDALRNAAYAVYQEAAGRTLRTAISANSDSVSRYGLTRRAAVKVMTTSSTQAGTHRDAFLQDRKDPIPRIRIVFQELYDASGARWPLYVCRSGDTMTIRNLPPTLSTAIDRIRTFRVDETEYQVDADVLTVTPESPLPSLDTMVARRAVGV